MSGWKETTETKSTYLPSPSGWRLTPPEMLDAEMNRTYDEKLREKDSVIRALDSEVGMLKQEVGNRELDIANLQEGEIKVQNEKKKAKILADKLQKLHDRATDHLAVLDRFKTKYGELEEGIDKAVRDVMRDMDEITDEETVSVEGKT